MLKKCVQSIVYCLHSFTAVLIYHKFIAVVDEPCVGYLSQCSIHLTRARKQAGGTPPVTGTESAHQRA